MGEPTKANSRQLSFVFMPEQLCLDLGLKGIDSPDKTPYKKIGQGYEAGVSSIKKPIYLSETEKY